MTHHHILPTRTNLHGHFSREMKPVLTIDSGDIVTYKTLDAGWWLMEQEDPFNPKDKFPDRHPDFDIGHALCGPIFIRGALPGMVLEIKIRKVVPANWGWSIGGGFPSPVNDRLEVSGMPRLFTAWKIDLVKNAAYSADGHTLKLKPFMGLMGMPADEPGILSTTPPRHTGGNIDCKELVENSSLFLPIAVPGGLFSVGDGHAVQGDGEVSGVALECPMEQVELEFVLHENKQLSLPRANTPSGWLTFGFHEDLNEATVLALDSMLQLMDELHHLKRTEALMLASLVVDLRITQVVNKLCGVHAVLPHGVLTS